MTENNEAGQITITLESDERNYSYETMGLTYESTDQEIIAALSPVVAEDVGIDMSDQYEDGYWTLKRIESTQNIYVVPKSTAGYAL